MFNKCVDVETQELLSHGADILAKDSYGWTALHLAAMHGKSKVVWELMDTDSLSQRDLTKYLYEVHSKFLLLFQRDVFSAGFFSEN